LYSDDIIVALQNGPGDWLVVDKHEVDISGTRCNKVGSYFSAFKRQPSKCHQQAGSYVYNETVEYFKFKYYRCFDNQPLDYWKVDDVCNLERNLIVL